MSTGSPRGTGFRLPHPFILLLGGVAVAAALTWILPAGAYERRTDAATGREVVIPGTYVRVAPAQVTPMAALIAVPRGMVAGADVILTILFAGATFVLLDASGALTRLVRAVSGRSTRPRVVVTAVALVFASFGAMENMYEEIVALIPPLLLLSRTLGFGAITALGMSAGAAVVGSAFGPTNPFVTVIALRFAGLPQLSQPGLRFALLGAAVAVWIAWTLVMAGREARDSEETMVAATTTTDAEPDASYERPSRRDLLLVAVASAPIAVYVYGVLRFEWGFNELSALFLVSGLAIGLLCGRSLSGSGEGLLEAMKPMLAAALFVGVARAISVVLTDGRIIDTIVHGLAAPLAGTPGILAGILMIPIHALVHIPVVSNSGHAVLTMPIMASLSDLLGVSRDAAVIAYQTGAGLMDMITPTNGALLAMLLSANVSYGRWLRFAGPGALLVALVGVVGIVLAG